MIRALVDPNIFISCLLRPDNNTPPNVILEAAMLDRFRLLLPNSVVEEFSRAISRKPYLNQRIEQADLTSFVVALLSVAERSQPLPGPPAPICRDPKDDYLLAHAVVEAADYLVSGDGDLLGLRDRWPVKIVSPAEFARILDDIPDGEG